MKNGFRSWHYVNAANKQTNKQTNKQKHIYLVDLRTNQKFRKPRPVESCLSLAANPDWWPISVHPEQTKQNQNWSRQPRRRTATTNPSTVPQNSNQHVKHLPKCTCYFVKVQSKIAHKYLSEICLGTTGMHYTHILHAQLSLHIFSWI